jgi:chromosome segregation ATPase
MDLPDSLLGCQVCDKPQVPRSQTIQLTLHPDRIIFTPTQFSRIQQINDKIKTLTQRLESDEMDFETNLRTIDQEIDELRTQLDEARREARAAKIKFDEHWESGSESFSDIRQVRSEIKEMVKRLEIVQGRLEEIGEQKAEYGLKLEESRKRFGIKSIGEGERRIEEIDERIERETLTNAQLRGLLREQERIRAGMKFLRTMAANEAEKVPIMEEDRELREELHDLTITLRERRRERKVINAECEEISAQTKILSGQKKNLRMRVFELQSKLDEKFDQKRCFQSGHGISKRVARGIQEEIESLEYEKMKISAEAEVATLKVMNERRREKAARTLIEYMSHLEMNHGRQERMKDTDAMKLIATLRQGSKKGRRMAKAEEVVRSGELKHDLDKLKMFEIVDIVPPKMIHEIPETTELLQQKLREWNNVEERSESTMNIMEMESLITQSSR